MVKFEVININMRNSSFTAEIEIEGTRERRFFGYPLGEGWEDEINGVPKFISDIQSKLDNEAKIIKSKKSSFEKKIKNFKGKKFGK